MGKIKRVTVIGGSGFIGRYVVQRLAQRGAVIAVLGRHASRAKQLPPMGDVGQIALVNGTLADEDLLARSIAGADTVVNLAGILSEGGKQRFDGIHHQGAGLVARIAADRGVERLVHISAIGANPDSASRYARSKAAGEAAIHAAFPKATILRPSIVFGPEDDFFNRFAGMARVSPILPLIGGGKSRFQPVYVGDVADAVMAALDRADAAGGVFELGGPAIYTFRELMELLLAQIDAADADSTLRRHALVTLPFPVASAMGAMTGFLWTLPFAQQLLGAPPLTLDQVTSLRSDNVVADAAKGLPQLGITPTAAELILPAYLARFRKGGWYTTKRMA